MSDFLILTIVIAIVFFLFLWRLRKVEKEMKLIMHNIDELHDISNDNHRDLCIIRLNLMKNSQKGGNHEYQ